jgi:hypothetical protein
MDDIRREGTVETPTTPFQAALKAGIVLGLVNVAIYYTLYFVDVELLASGYLGLGLMVLMVGIIMYFGIDYRKELGGFMSFGTAFQFVFLALLINGVISTMGNVLLFEVIDTDLPAVLAETQLESTLAIMDRFGAGDALSSAEMDELRTGFEKNYTALGLIKSLAVASIIYAILALILGAILKKRDKSLDY